MEIIKSIKDKDYELHNHIKIEAGNYTHKQIEKKDGKIYMRMKMRKMLSRIW